MSVNKLQVPTSEVDDQPKNGLPSIPDTDKSGKNLRAQTHGRNVFDPPSDEDLRDGSSHNDQNNRLRNNPDDVTEKDPTRSSDKPLSGKIQP
ncbi:hypothetical protein [uncultured Oxalicibacterium sp.]|uniref:hypothetical protein n=1 Tax=uncultured Oxalicibacterium sp. TaxID=1168540 RepID=UPI0025FB8C38|nr:hypothetical protein [uncultured Oxalicibacterium sp.]